MNPILIDLGIVKIYWYSVMILLGILIGGWIILKESNRFNINEDFIINLFFFTIPISIIGARIYYVLFSWTYYSQHISEIFKIWEGGLAIHGGIIFGLLWIIIYTKKYKANTLKILDILVVGLIIGQAIGRWGNFFNGEAHGGITTIESLQNMHLPQFIINGMNIGGIYYQPTFLYESIWCFIGFIILLIFRRIKYTKIGQPTSLYLIWYGIGRLIIESMRTDSLMIGPFKQAQIISIIMIVIGIIMFVIKNKSSKFENRYNEIGENNEIKF